jgi:aminopeptidase
MDPRIEKLAGILVNYSIEVKKDDWVVINGDAIATPLIKAATRLVLEAGGHPTVLLSDGGIGETQLRYSSDEQLRWVSPVSKLIYEKADAFITILAGDNTRALSGIDPAKQATRSAATRELTETFLKRSAAGKLNWVITQFPCHAYAQETDMSVRDYADFVYASTYADRDDAVERWQAFHERQERLIKWLKGRDKVLVRGPNIDLALSIKGRNFINADGKKNMPDGEIFTGPVEDSLTGWVRFTYPALRGGMEVDGVEFQFYGGKITKASAAKNEAYLVSQLDTDAGARYLGEFAIGTNYGIQKFSKNILFDEKIGGTLHMAVGAGYPETGSKNQSAIHWDFICDMRDDSEIVVDGELFYKNGQFVID